MKGFSVLSYSCKGASHEISGKPCQDCSASYSDNNFEYPSAMAIVSDGHGGARYFRSDKGSELAVKITKDVLKSFIKEKEVTGLLGDKSGTFGIESEVGTTKDNIYNNFKFLISSIITRWNREIKADAQKRPITEWERENVEEKYIKEFEDNLNSETFAFEKIYGCTLMACVLTEEYWFAFQIGDGKMVFFFRDDEAGIIPLQPVPWDERCFLNKTTSICDSDAASEFRFAYSGSGEKPLAVFLGSDGIDDTYGDGDRLTDFYIRLYKELVTTGRKKVLKMLETDLPQLSKIGSKDDMSIAAIYQNKPEFMETNYLLMSKWQVDNLENRISNIDKRIEELQQKIQKIGGFGDLSESQTIELNYARKDLDRAREEKRELESNISKIQSTDERFKENRIKDQ